MTAAGKILAILVLTGVAGAGGYWAGRHGVPVPAALLERVPGLSAWTGATLRAAPAPDFTARTVISRSKTIYSLWSI